MDSPHGQATEHEAQKAQTKREELITRLLQALPEDGSIEPLEGLLLSRASTPTAFAHSVFFPAFCVIAQGRKEILLGENCYWYESARYLIAAAELPIASRITEASPEQPYLNVILKLDAHLVSSVMVDAGHAAPQSQSLLTAMDVSPLDADLLDAVVRLITLLDAPSDAGFLAPMITREIVYRLLKGTQRGRLAHIAALGSNTQRITEAITRLRNDFDQPLRIEDVARELGMSVSGFHYHFKTLTAMSPLQFQKQLRLQEARRLMLGEGLDAASAGYRVGYEDASYFNREYKKLFGAPPLRDVERLREAAPNLPVYEARMALFCLSQKYQRPILGSSRNHYAQKQLSQKPSFLRQARAHITITWLVVVSYSNGRVATYGRLRSAGSLSMVCHEPQSGDG